MDIIALKITTMYYLDIPMNAIPSKYLLKNHFWSPIPLLRVCQTHCRWQQTARTAPGPTRSPQKNVMTCVPSGIFSLPIERKKKKGRMLYHTLNCSTGSNRTWQVWRSTATRCFLHLLLYASQFHIPEKSTEPPGGTFHYGYNFHIHGWKWRRTEATLR